MAERPDCYIIMDTHERPEEIAAGDIDGRNPEIAYEYCDNRLKVYLPASKILYLHILF